MNTDGISWLCIAASYALAWLLEWGVTLWPQRVPRLVPVGAAGAGLLAHSLYLARWGLPLQGGPSVLLLLSLILATFYLVGALHYRRRVWGVFVLPVILLLVLAAAMAPPQGTPVFPDAAVLRTLTWAHVVLLVLGDVGICVGAMASAMYLVQSAQLRAKLPPDRAWPLLSLERLEQMNRRAIALAFPLLTSGLLLGVVLMLQTQQLGWLDPKVIAAALLWAVFVVLLWLRYGLHVHARKLAWGTMLAFCLMLVAFMVSWIGPSTHPSAGLGAGGWP